MLGPFSLSSSSLSGKEMYTVVGSNANTQGHLQASNFQAIDNSGAQNTRAQARACHSQVLRTWPNDSKAGV